MILDKHNEFATAQAVTATAISENVIDLGDDSTLQNIGGSDACWLVLRTGTAITDTGSDATLAVTLESDSTADLATSPTVHASTGTLAFAAYSPANTIFAVIPLPFGSYERYLGLRFTVGAGPLTAGTIDAFLVKDPQFWRAFSANNPLAQ